MIAELNVNIASETTLRRRPLSQTSSTMTCLAEYCDLVTALSLQVLLGLAHFSHSDEDQQQGNQPYCANWN